MGSLVYLWPRRSRRVVGTVTLATMSGVSGDGARVLIWFNDSSGAQIGTELL